MNRGPIRLQKVVLWIAIPAALLTLAATTALILILRVPSEQIAPDLYLFKGPLGNVTALKTPEGSLVVDTMFWRYGQSIKRALSRPGDPPVRYVVNTHYHWDHTHGNKAFAGSTTFVSTPETRDLLLRLDPTFWASETARTALPSELVEEKDHRIFLGGNLIHVVRVGTGHTRGDCVVYFPAQQVVAAGDLFFNGYYPIVDQAAGGSMLEWIDTLDHVLALGPVRVVPGHGEIAGPDELKAFQGYLRDLALEVARRRSSGQTREQVAADIRLPVHEERMKNLYRFSSLRQNAGDMFDELEAGGEPPVRGRDGFDAIEGEPEDNEEEATDTE